MTWVEIMHYIVLFSILFGGGLVFYYVRLDSTMQLIVGVVTAIAYVLWGVIHHLIRKDFHVRIMVEYILMGAIAIIVLLTIIKT